MRRRTTDRVLLTAETLDRLGLAGTVGPGFAALDDVTLELAQEHDLNSVELASIRRAAKAALVELVGDPAAL